MLMAVGEERASGLPGIPRLIPRRGSDKVHDGFCLGSVWGCLGFPTTAFSASKQAASPALNHVDTLLSFEMSATVLLPGDVLPQLPGLAKLGPGTLQTSSRATPSSSSSSSPLLVATRAGILGADPKGKRMWVEGRGKRVRPLLLFTLAFGRLGVTDAASLGRSVRPSSSRIGRRHHRRPTWRRLQGRHRRVAHGFA